MLPFQLHLRPFPVGCSQIFKPAFQFRLRIGIMKPAYLFGIQIRIGHLHTDLFQIQLPRIDAGITFCLGKMNGICLFHSLHIPEYALDLINDIFFLLFKNTVCPSFHHQKKGLIVDLRL